MDAVAAVDGLDALHGGVEHVAAGRTADVLVVRRQVPGTQRRAGEPAEVGGARRNKRQLTEALAD
jgi:hypothetical protein